MKKGLIFSTMIGLLGALTSYFLIIVDTLTFGGNGFALLFLPLHMFIAVFVVVVKKPTVKQLVLRLALFMICYILLIKSEINFPIYDIVNNYSASYPEIHVAIIYDIIVICLTFIVATVVYIKSYTKESA